jgi:hypothetical protein
MSHTSDTTNDKIQQYRLDETQHAFDVPQKNRREAESRTKSVAGMYVQIKMLREHMSIGETQVLSFIFFVVSAAFYLLRIKNH